jgi:MFS transporter, SP family, general alpha glucoside:H+ symporter
MEKFDKTYSRDNVGEQLEHAYSQSEKRIVAARDAATAEHSYTVKEAFRLFRPAICWCFLFSLGVVMAGFDPQLIGALVAIPSFQRSFGEPFKGGYVVPAQWQSAFNLGVPVGQVVGSYGVGYPLEKLGRRWTLAGCCCISIIVVAIQVSAQNRAQLLVAELINGCALGAFPGMSLMS